MKNLSKARIQLTPFKVSIDFSIQPSNSDVVFTDVDTAEFYSKESSFVQNCNLLKGCTFYAYSNSVPSSNSKIIVDKIQIESTKYYHGYRYNGIAGNLFNSESPFDFIALESPVVIYSQQGLTGTTNNIDTTTSTIYPAIPVCIGTPGPSGLKPTWDMDTNLGEPTTTSQYEAETDPDTLSYLNSFNVAVANVFRRYTSNNISTYKTDTPYYPNIKILARPTISRWAAKQTLPDTENYNINLFDGDLESLFLENLSRYFRGSNDRCGYSADDHCLFAYSKPQNNYGELIIDDEKSDKKIQCTNLYEDYDKIFGEIDVAPIFWKYRSFSQNSSNKNSFQSFLDPVLKLRYEIIFDKAYLQTHDDTPITLNNYIIEDYNPFQKVRSNE